MQTTREKAQRTRKERVKVNLEKPQITPRIEPIIKGFDAIARSTGNTCNLAAVEHNRWSDPRLRGAPCAPTHAASHLAW